MGEKFPRWNLPEVDFVETDAEKIKSALINDFERISGRTLAVGDPVRLFILAVAAEIIRLRVAVNLAAQQNLLSYARGRNLDAQGVLLDTHRLPEAHAVTTIRFTLAQALGSVYTIPAGTEVTNGTVTFATSETLDIPIGEITGDVSAVCTAAGKAANGYVPGQISTIVKPLVFVQGAENITATIGGADEETDADYADRIRMAPNSFSVAGPEKAYVYHARSVSTSIVDVSVESPTPGVVKVYPLLRGGVIPSSEILEQVNARLNADDVRPLTDFVQTLAPSAVPTDVEVHYWIDRADQGRSTQIQQAVAQAVENYRLWQQSAIGRDITPDRLIEMVMSAGAARVDHSRLKPSAFATLTNSQVAQCRPAVVVYEGVKDE